MKNQNHIGDTNKMVTAVEWFIDNAFDEGFLWVTDKPAMFELNLIIDKAKEMQKGQMIGLLAWMNKIATEDPMRLETTHDDIVEQFYNEIFKK
jgi:hypothetical protein